MDRFRCTRCGSNLTADEYKNNVCLCNVCCSLLIQEENQANIFWNNLQFNNIDEILESKRLKGE